MASRTRDCGAGARTRRSHGRLRLEPLEPRMLLSTTEPSAQMSDALPALFVENLGQWADPAIHYVFQGSGATVTHTDSGPVFELFQRRSAGLTAEHAGDPHASPEHDDCTTQATSFSVRFDGANEVAPVGHDRSETVFNYFVGDPERWRTGIPAYEVVAYEALYDGIDLLTRGRSDYLKYEFRVAPGADYRQIQVTFEGIEELHIDDDGALHVVTDLGEVVDDAPFIYQDIEGRRVEVAGGFQLLGPRTYGFDVSGEYDASQALVLDPTLRWTYSLGWGYLHLVGAVAADETGAYVAGQWGEPEWFVAKRNTGGGQEWVTVTCPQGRRHRMYVRVSPRGIAVEGTSVYVAGEVTWKAGDGACNDYDAFAARLSRDDGVFDWMTEFNVSNMEWASRVAADASGVYVAGCRSEYNPWGPEDPDKDPQAFVTRIGTDGQEDWTVEFGNTGTDAAAAIALDSSGLYVAGYSWLEAEGHTDAFVRKFDRSGGAHWTVLLGGAGLDVANDLAIDGSGVYVTGRTQSNGWVSGGFDTELSGTEDGFVAVLEPSGGTTVWSSYLGGDGGDGGYDIAMGSPGIYISGKGQPGGFGTVFGGDDGFLALVTREREPCWAVGVTCPADIAASGLDVYTVHSASTSSLYYTPSITQYAVEPADWTVLFYMAGDRWENQALGNLNKLELIDLSASSGGRVELLVQIDRAAPDTGPWYSGDLVPSDGGPEANWSDTRRGRVTFDSNLYDGGKRSFATDLRLVNPLKPELNMADPQTLIDFIKWGTLTAPANHYALVLSDHGGGSIGLLEDWEPGPPDLMSLSELRRVFDDPDVPTIDVLAMNMCLMQTVEVAAELIGEVDYLVGSEDVTLSPSGNAYLGEGSEHIDGSSLMNHDRWLAYLAAHPKATGWDLATNIWAVDINETMSVVDMSTVGRLIEAIDGFTDYALQLDDASVWERLKDARRSATFFRRGSYRDLGEYMSEVASDSVLPWPLRSLAGSVRYFLDTIPTVLRHKGEGSGLSVYLPVGASKVDYRYTATRLSFLQMTGWETFLRRLPNTGVYEVWDEDWGEEIFGAPPFGASPYTDCILESEIGDGNDVDFVSLDAAEGNALFANVLGDPANDGLSPVLTLYAPDQETVLAQATAGPDGSAKLDQLDLPEGGSYYLAVSSSGNHDPLEPAGGATTGSYTLWLIHGDPAELQPDIAVDTAAIRLDSVPVGDETQAIVEISNSGALPLDVIELRTGSGSAFSAPAQALPVPLTLPPGDTIEIAVAARPGAAGLLTDTLHVITNDPDEPDCEIALSVRAVDAPYRETLTAGKKNERAMTFTDADGDVVTVTLGGRQGTAEIDRAVAADEPGDIVLITLDGTDAKSTLKITSKGETSVWDIIVHGALKQLVAKTTTLLGDLTVDDWLGKAILGDIADQHSITLGGADDDKPITFTAGHIEDLTFASGAPVRAFTALDWLDTDATADTFTAPSLGSLTTKGRKENAKKAVAAIAGDFEATLDIGAGLGKAKIAGSVTQGTWTIAGTVGSILTGLDFCADLDALSVKSMSVKRNLDGATIDLAQAVDPKLKALSKLIVTGWTRDTAITTAGHVAKFQTGGMDGSCLLLGVTGMELPDEAADFAGEALLKSFTVKGIKDGKVYEDSFIDSDVAAWSITKASIREVVTDNAGDPFGFAWCELKSLKWQDGRDKFKWPEKKPTDWPEDTGDFTPLEVV